MHTKAWLDTRYWRFGASEHARVSESDIAIVVRCLSTSSYPYNPYIPHGCSLSYGCARAARARATKLQNAIHARRRQLNTAADIISLNPRSWVPGEGVTWDAGSVSSSRR